MSTVAAAALLVSNQAEAALRTVYAANVTEFKSRVANAVAGDLIVLRPGTYVISGKVSFTKAGTPTNPIEVKAESGVVIQSTTAEMFAVSAPHWRFTNLSIEGKCSTYSTCDHAFHLTGGAHSFQLKGSTLRNFNAHIKSNGVNGVYPSTILIESNHFYNTFARNVGVVTPIDVVGGSDWIIRGNIIADFHKSGGNYISYGAFLKGESKNGLMENNLIACKRDVAPPAGAIHVGLSFGGGLTGDAYCAGGKCDYEHYNGTMRNNVIVNCSDVGIDLNRAQNSKLVHNTLVYTRGINIRGTNATGTKIYNNVTSGISRRDGMTYTGTNNLIAANSGTTAVDLEDIFMTPAQGDLAIQASGSSVFDKGINMLTATTSLPAVTKDFCGQSRDSTPDVGAIQYNASTSCAPYIKSLYDR